LTVQLCEWTAIAGGFVCILNLKIGSLQDEPDGERAKAEPPGLVPLRLHQRDAHHPVGQLGRLVDGKRRYAVNGVSFAEADTPLKLADYYNISGVFRLGGIPDAPPPANGTGAAEEVQNETAVMDSDRRSFVEVVLDNGEDSVQTWHLDGYSVFVVGYCMLGSTRHMTCNEQN